MQNLTGFTWLNHIIRRDLREQCCPGCYTGYTENSLDIPDLGEAGPEVLQMVNRESDLCWHATHV